MKKSADATDKVDFQNFGEKYCACAANKPLDNDAAVQKAIRYVCQERYFMMPWTHSKKRLGLSEAKDTDINEYCVDRWNLVYPKQSDAEKQIVKAYCECAKPKLIDLIKQSDNVTDKQYDEGIDSIADACSDHVKQEAPPVNPSSQAPAASH